MAAIPRVSSHTSLASAGRATSQAWRNHQSAASGHRRQSHEFSRPKSRCSSSVDLLGLAAADCIPTGTSTSRPVTPLLFPLLTEGLGLASHAANADETLSFIATLGVDCPAAGDLGAADQVYASWANEGQALPPIPASPTVDCVVHVAPVAAAKAMGPAAEVAAAVPAAAAESAGLSCFEKLELHRQKQASMCPAEEQPAPVPEPEPAATTLYRGVHDLSYVQELMDNLRHVQSLFKGVAASSTPAASAMAASRMLSRSLLRAEKRIRGVVQDAAAVLLAPGAMHTLTEFGWVEIVTLNETCAKALGALEMEIHNLAAGTSKAFHRATVDGPWVQVGVSARISSDVSRLLQELPHNCLEAPGDVTAPATAVTVEAGSSGVEGGKSSGLLSLADLADQMAAAAASVQAAAAAMQQFVEEQKAAAADLEGGMAMPAARPAVLVAAGAV